jgi:hypothetical protein
LRAQITITGRSKKYWIACSSGKFNSMDHLSHRFCAAPMMDWYDLSALVRLSSRSRALRVH